SHSARGRIVNWVVQVSAIKSLWGCLAWVEFQRQKVKYELTLGFIERLNSNSLVQSLAGKQGIDFCSVIGRRIVGNFDFELRIVFFTGRFARIRNGLSDLVIAHDVRIELHGYIFVM